VGEEWKGRDCFRGNVYRFRRIVKIQGENREIKIKIPSESWEKATKTEEKQCWSNKQS